MTFEAIIRKIEDNLEIPFPERLDFLNEVRADLEIVYKQCLGSGQSPDEAADFVQRTFSMSQNDIFELNEVHSSFAQKIMRNLPISVSRAIMDFSGMVPLVIFLTYVVKEVKVFNFLREGGLPFMFAILLVGGAGVFILLRHAFRWFILRDHTRQSLSSFNSGPLYLAAASFLVGVLCAAAGYRIVFVKWAEGQVPEHIIKAGLAEPLAAVIVASAVAGVIVLIHGWLATWRNNILIVQSKVPQI